MNKILKVTMHVALVAVLFAACAAFADEDSNFFQEAINKLGAVFKSVRTVVYLLGAFALIGFAVAAIFGKLQWTKVAILAVGLAVLAIADRVVSYATTTGDPPEVTEWNVIEN